MGKKEKRKDFDRNKKTPKRWFFFVSKEGLEPSILTEPVPKTGAYTNSATCPMNSSLT
jgi:hypothetical protein